MKGNERLLDAIGNADEELIPDTKRKMSRKAIAWTAAGGGLCAAAAAAVIAFTGSGGRLSEADRLFRETMENHRIFPEYTYEKKQGEIILPGGMEDSGGGMGYLAYSVYDISELDSNNPWTEDTVLDTLPVFRNHIKTDGGIEMCSYYTQKEAETMLKNAAHALGLSIDEIDYVYAPDSEGNNVTVDDNSPVSGAETICDGSSVNMGMVTLLLEPDGSIFVVFENCINLPEEYNASNSPDDKSEAYRTTEYLVSEYRNLIQLEKPVITSWLSRTYKGEAHMKYSAYSKTDDPVEAILNYNFRSVSFEIYMGKLNSIRMENGLANTEYIGDYPIITADEARQLLLDGEYITSVPSDSFEAEDVEKVELIYRSVPWEEYFLPYYCFYVDITDELPKSSDERKLLSYGVYYVPAIEEEYREDIPLWDGTIN